MSFSNAAETEILDLIFAAGAWANIADNAASAPLTNLYVALHTADPGEAGDATTNESAYTNYARVAVARSGSGWTVSGNSVSNAAAVTFPTCGATGSTITHFSVTTASSGASTIIIKGALSATYNAANGNTPEFATGQLSATLD